MNMIPPNKIGNFDQFIIMPGHCQGYKGHKDECELFSVLVDIYIYLLTVIALTRQSLAFTMTLRLLD